MKCILSLLSFVCLLGFSWTVFSLKLEAPYLYTLEVEEDGRLDGDTVDGWVGSEKVRVRLNLVQCDEAGTSDWDRVTKLVNKYLDSKDFTLRTWGKWYYGRIIWTLYYKWIDINNLLISSWLCDVYTKK